MSRESEWITVADAAELLGCVPQTVRNRVADWDPEQKRVVNKRGDLELKREAVLALRPTRRVRRATAGADPGFRFANLRLIEVNEGYERAIVADRQAADLEREAARLRAMSVDELLKAGAGFRAALAALHIPDDGRDAAD